MTSRLVLAAIRVPIVVLAVLGWYTAMTSSGRFVGTDWMYFSQCSTIMVGIVQLVVIIDLLAGAGGQRVLRILRGATTSYALVTMIVYATLLGGDYSSFASVMEHLATPLLALAEWLVVPPVRRVRWRWSLLWTIIPLAYLPVYVYACGLYGRPLYDFLDPDKGDFVGWVLTLLLGFMIIQQLVWFVGRVRTRRDQSPEFAVASGAVGPEPRRTDSSSS